MNLEENIQTFDIIESQIKIKLEEIKQLRIKKQKISSIIMIELENKNLNNSTLNILGRKIKINNSKIHTPLSFTFLTQCLSEIIPNKSQVSQIIEYIKKNREYKIVSELKRF